MGDLALLIEECDDRRVGVFVGLGGVGGGQGEALAGEGDDHVLQPAAESEVGDALLECEAGDADLALDPALAEATGDDDAIDVCEGGGDLWLFGVVEVVGLNPGDIDAGPTLGGGVDQRFFDGEVGIAELDVFANDGDTTDSVGLGEAIGPFEP